jgi:tRNA (guanine-N7-)-methyltransferase
MHALTVIEERSEDAETGHPVKHLYGRRKGRPLRAGRQRLIDELLPRLRFAVDEGTTGLDLAALFGRAAPLWLEIGFGGGEHLADQAAAYPAMNHIGCEYFINGVSSLLRHVEDRQLGNVRVLMDDAKLLLPLLPPGSLARVFVLFADPWRKARHAKRRFVQTETLAALHGVMAEGAQLRLASDHPKLIEWYDAVLPTAQRWFEIDYRAPLSGFDRPADWPPTRYEQKAIAAGREPIYWSLTRKS